MAKEGRDAVADFLVRRTPAEVVEGLTVLADLDLPVHDERSFRQQLDGLADQDGEKPGVEALRGRFGPGDFPILSVESAFEKYWEEFQPRPEGFPLADLELPVEPPGPSGPPICEVYEKAFDGPGTPGAADPAGCACRAYGHALAVGATPHRAILRGFAAGKHAEETGDCRV